MTNRNESRRPRAQAVGLDTHAVICDHGGAESRPQLVIRPEGPGWTRLQALTLSPAVGPPRLPQLRELLAIWGDRGRPHKRHQVMETWRRWAVDVQGEGLPLGHFLAEEAPDETRAALERFVSGHLQRQP